jgi:hypothetical protein
MPKGIWLIIPAAFIDLMSVFISWLCIVMGATAGTTGGAAIAYAACSAAGSTVANVCAVAGGALGTVVDPYIATVGIPLGIVLGDAITVCLTIMGLALFLIPLASMRMFYWKYLFMDLGKLVPIVNWLPFLSLFVGACIVRRYMDDKKQAGSIAGVAAGLLGAAISPGTAAGAMLSAGASLNASKQRMASDVRPPQRNYESATA